MIATMTPQTAVMAVAMAPTVAKVCSPNAIIGSTSDPNSQTYCSRT
jgi:hypothetical protein